MSIKTDKDVFKPVTTNSKEAVVFSGHRASSLDSTGSNAIISDALLLSSIKDHDENHLQAGQFKFAK